MHITAEQIQQAFRHLNHQLDQAGALLDQAFEAHLNSVLDNADSHPDYEGAYGDQLHDLRLELDHFRQTATSFHSEMESFGLDRGGIGAENETTEELLQRMKHKGDVMAMLSAIHNEIAETSQKVGLLYKRIAELAQLVNKSKADASLEELKRKMGLK